MRKAAYIVTLVLQVALIAGAYVVDYFATQKMGMMRWLNFHNQQWANAMPLETLKIAVLVVILLATLLLFALSLKKITDFDRMAQNILIVTIIAACAYAYFILTNDVSATKAYYLMCPLFSIAMVLQLIKAAVAVHLA